MSFPLFERLKAARTELLKQAATDPIAKYDLGLVRVVVSEAEALATRVKGQQDPTDDSIKAAMSKIRLNNRATLRLLRKQAIETSRENVIKLSRENDYLDRFLPPLLTFDEIRASAAPIAAQMRASVKPEVLESDPAKAAKVAGGLLHQALRKDKKVYDPGDVDPIAAEILGIQER